MRKVRKAIIPAAGLGTRFLPATKAMPKEMLPIVDKPTIQYIVEEAIQSGIEEIIIVTGKGKRAIEDHFDSAFELEHTLIEKGKFTLLREVQKSSNLEIHYIRQKEAKGLGHAVWCARKFIGNEPFAVLLGDDIVQGEIPCTKQLMDQYEKTGSSIIGVQAVGVEQTERYGIVDPLECIDRLIKVNRFVEKPSKGTAPSNLAIMGRYVFTPEIFTFLDQHQIGSGGEIQLTDAIQQLNETQGVYAYDFEGTRYDVGEKLGFILTTLDFALRNDELKYPLMTALEELVEKYSKSTHSLGLG
ncbi:UTP--glucose-1-phosphate uridylyltransferase GalU [Paenibacillus herberti]|uniref:UTP--glucose-1-phosphate uridylyltransferase n=1 Tax=Paenibacillus herberti TaxID=1619309 RepID=A0A229NUY4_9BACL|nr:UTP--glucose-1-phosphate uridylyltransferase GalU [Paenibacillus herberti]OXM13701.1 UTP--glucose-1-phosphate uridylyltransferase [Paenibacillus herberti]